MALRHENVFYKHALQGFLARLIWQTKRWYRLAWACIPTILHAQLSQINTVISGERHKLFNNYNDPGFISSLYQSYSLKLNFKNWILSFLYLQNPHLWSKAMLLAPVMREKQRRKWLDQQSYRKIKWRNWSPEHQNNWTWLSCSTPLPFVLHCKKAPVNFPLKLHTMLLTATGLRDCQIAGILQKAWRLMQALLLRTHTSTHKLAHSKYAECSKAISSQQIILPAEILSSSKIHYTFHIFFFSDRVG